MNQRCIPTYRITVLSLCRPHTTHGTHSLTLKCSLKLEQRCVIRCVRPTSTTCRRRAGRHRQTLLSLSWLLSAVLQSEDLYDLLLLWWSPYYSAPPLLLFTGCCQNTPEDESGSVLLGRAAAVRHEVEM